jgi:glucose repression mediator protein
VDVNENYDEDDEEDKKGGIVGTNGSGPASASADGKTSTPTSGGINGVAGTAPKVEAS